MDIWKYYDITHRRHVVCNPTSSEKLSRLVELLELPRGARVVDIGCGKGEFLIRLAEAYGINGTGIDISPYFVAEAKRNLAARSPRLDVSFMEMNGADFLPETPQSFRVASCIGASWIFGGHAGTLDALLGMVEPGGWVIVGEPYWLQEPSEEYLQESGDTRGAYATHTENVETGEERGLTLLHTLVSSQDDWDVYEGLQWYASDDYARGHPEDPDVREVTEKVAKNKAAYLRWGRETVGWAIYAFKRGLAV